MTEWRDIETAPVDGSLLLLANLPAGMVTAGFLEWSDGRGGSRYIQHWSVHPNGQGKYKATHWMPLPPPPAVDGGK